MDRVATVRVMVRRSNFSCCFLNPLNSKGTRSLQIRILLLGGCGPTGNIAARIILVEAKKFNNDFVINIALT